MPKIKIDRFFIIALIHGSFLIIFPLDPWTKENGIFFRLFLFKLNYQPAHVNGNNNQGASRDLLIHLFAFSPPLALQVGLIDQIDGARANWTKVIHILASFLDVFGGVRVVKHMSATEHFHHYCYSTESG